MAIISQKRWNTACGQTPNWRILSDIELSRKYSISRKGCSKARPLWYGSKIFRDPDCMPGKRYSLLVADRSSGVVRRLTVGLRPFVVLAAVILTVPIALTLHVGWSTQTRIDELSLENAKLIVENSTYRAAASELSTTMVSLQAALSSLATRTDIDPHLRTSVDRLPDGTHAAARVSSGEAPEATRQTLGRLHTLLGSLGRTLQGVREGVAYREALVAATPIMWPADGWISAGYGYRADPFTGERDFHPAVDISSRKGHPVYATATGRVISASRNGAYGNLVEIDHGFGLVTRYGHLNDFAVDVGATVLRGDVIGSVGATGRATGYHVHYEVWASGQTINPMRLLVDTDGLAAN